MKEKHPMTEEIRVRLTKYQMRLLKERMSKSGLCLSDQVRHDLFKPRKKSTKKEKALTEDQIAEKRIIDHREPVGDIMYEAILRVNSLRGADLPVRFHGKWLPKFMDWHKLDAHLCSFLVKNIMKESSLVYHEKTKYFLYSVHELDCKKRTPLNQVYNIYDHQ